jgi:NAD(P)-dependent dehydrogenase (short-subunit alcohol dehydrogenase family)
MNKKVVLVTGSSRGIGKATIIEFASKGYDVVINYVKNHDEAIETEKEIKNKYDVRTLVIETDVSDEEQVKKMVEKIISEYGRIDVLVNNAGIVYDVEFEDRTTAQ